MQSNVLNHLAIIMDGNGRWAREKNLPTLEGHKAGAKSVQRIIETAIQENIKYLSLYAFSSENWNRPALEVAGLMELLEYNITHEVNKLIKNGVKVVFIGNFDKLNPNLREKMHNLMDITTSNTRLTLYAALSYGGRQEIIDTCSKIAALGLKKDNITEDLFRQNLYAPNMPDVDLLIRTSGEQRISNFLLWHIAYSELYFSSKYWPDFNSADLKEAIKEFKTRARNFGCARNVN